MLDWLKKLKDVDFSSLLDSLPPLGFECVPWLEFLKQASLILKTGTDWKGQGRWHDEILDLLP